MTKSGSRRLLILLLCASAVLRFGLALRGGQDFWPDEARYMDARAAAQDLLGRRWRAASAELFGHGEHPGFRWIALPAALVEEVVGPHPALPAAYLGLYGVVGIALIWGIARRLGAGEAEALWAAFFAAGAASLFFYSRHYFPYDASLCLMLAALWVGLGPPGWRRPAAAGVLAAWGFLVYNGYWMLGGCVLALVVLFGPGGRGRIATRTLGAAAGLALGVGAFAACAAWAGFDWVGQSRRFAGTITQGDFGQGWRVVAGYLWSAERGMLLLWLLAWGCALAVVRDRPGRRRLAAYGSGLCLVAAGLVFFSDVVPKFAVYGRLVRGAVPFLCLGAAAGAAGWAGSSALRSGILAAAALALAAVNFSVPWRQVFPDGFTARVAEEVARSAQPGLDAYRLEHAGSLWGRSLAEATGPGTVLLRRSHPLQFKPYQFEGYSLAQRRALDARDAAMKLFLLPERAAPPAPDWAHYSGPVRFAVTVPSDRPGSTEPLLASGRPGAGDVVFVHYLDGARIAFGFEHWGAGARFSEPVAVTGNALHQIVLAAGSLLPPAEAAADVRHPEWRLWRSRLVVWFDGRMVYFLPAEFHPAPADQVVLGINLIGSTLAEPSFRGGISGLAGRSLTELAAALPEDGPVRFRLRFPEGRFGRHEPLVVSGAAGRGDLLSVGYVDPDHIRFALDHWGRSYIESDSVPIDYGRLHDLEIRLPASADPAPGADGLIAGPLVVRLDGAAVWTRPVELFRAAPGTRDFGANRIGGSTCEPAFTGTIVSVGPAGEGPL